mmetsp:Transcript_1587/g.3067  ORF Transcript_1587/g.3067 Transcript_1587/m.3067 type:complete len:353 (+) Transcript_1587:248-1306(+)
MPFGRCMGATLNQAKRSLRILENTDNESERPRHGWQWNKIPHKPHIKQERVRLMVMETVNAVVFGEKCEYSTVNISGLIHAQAEVNHKVEVKFKLAGKAVRDVKTTTFSECMSGVVKCRLGPGGNGDPESIDNIVMCTYVASTPTLNYKASYKVLSFSPSQFTAQINLCIPSRARLLDLRVEIPLTQATFCGFQSLTKDETDKIKGPDRMEPGIPRCAVWRPLQGCSFNIATSSEEEEKDRRCQLNFRVKLAQIKDTMRNTPMPADNPTSHVMMHWKQLRAISGMQLQLTSSDGIEMSVVESARTERLLVADLEHYSGKAASNGVVKSLSSVEERDDKKKTHRQAWPRGRRV